MKLTDVKPGDLAVVDVDSAPAGASDGQGRKFPDTSFVAWVIDTNVRRKWNEGDREIRVEPVHSNVSYRLVQPSAIKGFFPHKRGARPRHIEALMRDYDPTDYLGGVL